MLTTPRQYVKNSSKNINPVNLIQYAIPDKKNKEPHHGIYEFSPVKFFTIIQHTNFLTQK